MRGSFRRAFAQPARGLLRLLLCALSTFAVAGAVSSLKLMDEADGPAERFDLHAATRLDRTYRSLGLFEEAGVERMVDLVPGIRAITTYSESNFLTLERAGDRFELYAAAYVTPDYFTMGDVQLLDGDYFGWDEVEFGDRVAQISAAAAELMFPAGDALGSEVLMMPSRAPYRILGIYRRARSGAGPGFLVPPSAGRTYRTVAVSAEPGRAAEVRRDIVVAARSIDAEELAEAGYVPGNDFLINNAGEYGSEASLARRTLVSLALIGVVSLVVAGMGVFSMATVEVAQRQRTIGLQRSMGASGVRVVWSLMADAALMGVVGAALGLVLAALLLPQLEPAVGFQAAVSRTNLRLELVTAGISVGVIGLLSVLASVAPAMQAVRLPPVVALREA